MKFAVLISGNGSNLQAIIDACSRGDITSSIAVVVSNKEDAYGLQRAKKAGIPAYAINHTHFDKREDFDEAILDIVKAHHVDAVILAGYMRILSDTFINAYPNKILNIHPSLLPKFKGAHAIRDAFEAGVKETGATVHFVVPELDSGPIILQKSVSIESNDTLESLKEKIHAVEHQLYPKAIQLLEQGKLKS